MAVLKQRDRFCRLGRGRCGRPRPADGRARRRALPTCSPGCGRATPTVPIYSTVTGDLLDRPLADPLLGGEPAFAGALLAYAAAAARRRAYTFLEISPHPILLSAVREDAEDMGRSCTTAGIPSGCCTAPAT